jgi:hypothetical protein
VVQEEFDTLGPRAPPAAAPGPRRLGRLGWRAQCPRSRPHDSHAAPSCPCCARRHYLGRHP